MVLKLLHIISFGGLSNREIRLDDGVNVILGANESGKSSAAMFIKFIFYGLSQKSARSGEPSERARYINRLTGQAAGYIIAEIDDGTEYRIERAILTSDDAPSRERVRIINMTTGESSTGQNPGEYFFGVSEEVFVNTCFVGQAAVIKPDSSGVGSAIENMLTSADENIDVKKAIRTLDNVRREICHKNGNGGELNEFLEKRNALADEVKNSSGRAAEIISVSSSLHDIKKRIDELWDDKRRYDGIFSSLDKIMLKRRIDAAEQAEKNITALRDTLAALDASPLGNGFTDAVDEVERDIRAYDEARAAYGGEIPDVFPDEDIPEEDPPIPEESADEIVEKVYRLGAAARRQFAVAVALLIAGLFGLVASLLMYYFNTDKYILPLFMTLALVTFGVILIVRHTKSSSALNRILREWGAESAEEIENAIAERTQVLESTQIKDPQKQPIDSVLENAMVRYDDAMLRLEELCGTAGLTCGDDVYETLADLRNTANDIRADREAMTAKLSNLTGKLEVMNEQLVGVDRVNAMYEYEEVTKLPYGQTAASLTADGIKTMMRERDFTNSALKSAEKRQHELETRLASLGTLTHSPDETATAIDELDRRIEELSLRHDACELAKEALITAGENMRSGILPKIANSASILLSGATSGAHENMTLDNNFNAGCATESDILSGEHLSRGTSDLAYLSLRIALAEEIFKTETPFMVFDESFAHIDASRIEAITSLMIDGQYVILTCHREEASAAEGGGALKIDMG